MVKPNDNHRRTKLLDDNNLVVSSRSLTVLKGRTGLLCWRKYQRENTSPLNYLWWVHYVPTRKKLHGCQPNFVPSKEPHNSTACKKLLLNHELMKTHAHAWRIRLLQWFHRLYLTRCRHIKTDKAICNSSGNSFSSW